MSGDSFRLSKCISLPQNITEVPSDATPEKQGIKLIQYSEDMLIITLSGLCINVIRFISCMLQFLLSDSADHDDWDFVVGFCDPYT